MRMKERDYSGFRVPGGDLCEVWALGLAFNGV